MGSREFASQSYPAFYLPLSDILCGYERSLRCIRQRRSFDSEDTKSRDHRVSLEFQVDLKWSLVLSSSIDIISFCTTRLTNFIDVTYCF